MTDITLNLSRPYMNYNPVMADKIVLPAEKGNLTILADRAPTSLLLKSGVIKLLDHDNKLIHHYFISAGVADVAKDICNVSAEIIDSYEDISIESAKLNRDNAKTESQRDYYQMIVDELEIFGRVEI